VSGATPGATRSIGRCLYSPRVNDEFNWWLLIVGLVVGAGLMWLILADGSRREADVTTRERAGESLWIEEQLRRSGTPLPHELVAEVLDLHAAYLTAPPPDEPAPVEGEDGAPPPQPTEGDAATAPKANPGNGGDGVPA
jgi:hypothetical protein